MRTTRGLVSKLLSRGRVSQRACAGPTALGVDCACAALTVGWRVLPPRHKPRMREVGSVRMRGRT